MTLLSAHTGPSSLPIHSLPQDQLRGQCEVMAVTEVQEGAVSAEQDFPGR